MPVPISDVAAPHILGYLFNWGLFGVLVVQVYLYYLAFPNDRPTIKYLVAFSFMIETAQTAMLTHDAYMDFGINFANPKALLYLPLAAISVPILTSIAGCVVQIFFAFRLKILSNSYVIPGVVVLLSAAQTTSGIVLGVKSFPLSQPDVASKLRSLITTWVVLSAACDVFIAATMSFFLSRRRTGFRPTDVVISKLIRLVIETGTLTAFFGILVVILLFAVPGPAFFPVVEIIGKLYSNNLLVMLNRRIQIGNMPASNLGAEDKSLTLTSMVSALQGNASTYENTRYPPKMFSSQTSSGGVEIQKHTWTDAVSVDFSKDNRAMPGNQI